MADEAAGGGEIPKYEAKLSAYHRAYADELRGLIAALPIAEGDRILEVACGDGAYAPWLAERAGTTGRVVATDVEAAYLGLAKREATSPQVQLAGADLDQLPFADDTFDFAWCAQSFYSLPDPVAAVRRMARVVRPGGVVAVLENDMLHHVLLPWPVDLELAVRRAERELMGQRGGDPSRFYVGRRLVGLFQQAGLVEVRTRTHATDRQGPLGEAERTFLGEYLRELRDRVAPRLDPAARSELARWVADATEGGLVFRPDFVMTTVDHVAWGFKPIPPD